MNGHVEELSRSRCKLASGEKLWCGSCHDPHNTPLDKAAWYRERCFACHNTASCTAAASERAAKADSCTACHMRRSGVRDVQHAAYTDHTISKRQTASLLAKTPKLVPFGGPVSEREWGVASALIALRENNRKLGTDAFTLLQTAWRQNPEDTAAGSQLAQLYDRMGQEQTACEIYGQIGKTAWPPAAAANNWGACLAKQGRLSENIPIWRSVTQRSPAEESAWTNLAFAQIQTGDPASGRATLESALRFNPTSAKARELLKSLRASPSEHSLAPRPEHIP